MHKKLIFVIAMLAFAVKAENKAHKGHKPPIPVEEGTFSDKEHYHDGVHDPKFDQDAFLGEDQAKAMENMMPDDVVERLTEIFKKVDVNKDSKVSRKELVEWIVDNMNKHVGQSTKFRMVDMDTNKDGKVTWEEYIKVEASEDKVQRKNDERRFKAADSDNDKALNEHELSMFLHPEESPRMTSVLVEENLEMMDKNGDGMVDFKEYNTLDETELDKESMDSLKETFNKELDKNKDGKLDKDELKEWIMPGADSNPAEGEADHLMKEADTNKDNFLTLKELLEQKELFVGGRVTAYGELLRGEEL